jgi:hypothetical protein
MFDVDFKYVLLNSQETQEGNSGPHGSSLPSPALPPTATTISSVAKDKEDLDLGPELSFAESLLPQVYMLSFSVLIFSILILILGNWLKN